MLSEEARAALCGRPGNKTIDPALDVSIISSDCSHMAKACVNMLGIGGITLDAEIKHTIKVEYGGSFENLPQDIIDRIRAACARPHSQHEGASFGKVAELLNAIVGGDAAQVGTLLRKADPVLRKELSNSHNASCDTALVIATKRCSGAIVDVLVANGADVNARSPNSGATALHEACWACCTEVVDRLCSLGAFPRARITGSQRELDGFTPMHLTAKRNDVTSMITLYNAAGANAAIFTDLTPAGDPPFSVASLKENVQAVRMMSMFGVDINALTEIGVSALHNAVLNEHTEMVKTLLDIGCEVDVLSQNSETPLFIACFHGLVDMVDLLIDAGCDLNIATDQGSRAFHAATTMGHTDLAAFIYSKGAKCACESKCTKCRLSIKQVERRLERQRLHVEKQKQDLAEAAARQAELDEVEAISFVDFVAELKAVEQEIAEYTASLVKPKHDGASQRAGAPGEDPKRSRSKKKKSKKKR